MPIPKDFEDLMWEFQKQIDCDWEIAVKNLPKTGVYLPNRIPDDPVDYVLIGAEPSGTWDSQEAVASIERGFKNFHGSWGDFILHYSIREFLLEHGQTYYLTDLSKGAMPTILAEYGRSDRYARWFPLLKKELEMAAKPDATVIAIGKSTAKFLNKRILNGHKGHSIVHYSQQAAGSWKRVAESNEELFSQFAPTVKPSSFKLIARQVLRDAGMQSFEADILRRLNIEQGLTESRKQLIFTYKMQFAEIRQKISEGRSG